MFKKTVTNKEVKKFTSSDVQKLTEKQLKQTLGGYQEGLICYDEWTGKKIPC